MPSAMKSAGKPWGQTPPSPHSGLRASPRARASEPRAGPRTANPLLPGGEGEAPPPAPPPPLVGGAGAAPPPRGRRGGGGGGGGGGEKKNGKCDCAYGMAPLSNQQSRTSGMRR